MLVSQAQNPSCNIKQLETIQALGGGFATEADSNSGQNSVVSHCQNIVGEAFGVLMSELQDTGAINEHYREYIAAINTISCETQEGVQAISWDSWDSGYSFLDLSGVFIIHWISILIAATVRGYNIYTTGWFHETAVLDIATGDHMHPAHLNAIMRQSNMLDSLRESGSNDTGAKSDMDLNQTGIGGTNIDMEHKDVHLTLRKRMGIRGLSSGTQAEPESINTGTTHEQIATMQQQMVMMRQQMAVVQEQTNTMLENQAAIMKSMKLVPGFRGTAEEASQAPFLRNLC